MWYFTVLFKQHNRWYYFVLLTLGLFKFKMKNLYEIVIAVAAIALGATSAAPVSAGNITFRLSGVIDEVNNANGLLDSSVQVGNPFSGSYTFNSTAPDSNPSSSSGDYDFHGDPFGIALSFGNYAFQSNDVYITVTPIDVNFGGSAYRVEATGELLNTRDPSDQASVYLELSDPSQDLFSSNALLLTPPNLGLFENRRLAVNNSYFSISDNFYGTINSFTPVPEPSSMLGTLALGVFGTAGYMLKRKKSSP